MKLLLDTCTFIWLIEDDSQLSSTARELFSDPTNEVYLSAVSAWEIAVKYALGKLALIESPAKLVTQQRIKHGISSLTLSEDAALQVSRLPPYHRDPFDRMLICQALVDGLVVLTPDPAFFSYPVRTLW